MNPVHHQLEEIREAQRALHRLYVNTLYRMFAMESTLRALARQHPHPEELVAAVQRTLNETPSTSFTATSRTVPWKGWRRREMSCSCYSKKRSKPALMTARPSSYRAPGDRIVIIPLHAGM